MKNSYGSFKPMRAVDGKLKPQFRWPNVIINNVKCLFLQNSFFYLRKIDFFERNFDIRLKTYGLRDVIGGTQR